MLSLVLSGCSGSPKPPRTVLLDALALQIQLTQTSIDAPLGLNSIGIPEVNHLRVEEQEEINYGEAKLLKLVGHFGWRLEGDRVRVESPFELFLERGGKGQSWRLARLAEPLDGTSQDWITYAIPIRD